MIRALAVLALLTGCAGGTGDTRAVAGEIMRRTGTAVPDASARVYPADAPAGPASACVTDAGYCPLPRAVAAGLDCTCDSASASYGGSTGSP